MLRSNIIKLYREKIDPHPPFLTLNNSTPQGGRAGIMLLLSPPSPSLTITITPLWGCYCLKFKRGRGAGKRGLMILGQRGERGVLYIF